MSSFFIVKEGLAEETRFSSSPPAAIRKGATHPRLVPETVGAKVDLTSRPPVFNLLGQYYSRDEIACS